MGLFLEGWHPMTSYKADGMVMSSVSVTKDRGVKRNK